jgi:hypothetical protein
VSKLCCPVCWELLNIFKDGDSANFHVNGYDKTILQVELPDWLPLEIVVKLTGRFEEILLEQIRTLVERHRNPPDRGECDFDTDSEDECVLS